MIKRIAPDAEILDITHGIAPQHVLQGALVLANALSYVPVGIHVAVVDPGVGGERKPLALRGGDGRLYVGPDNGVLLVAAERLNGVQDAVEITNLDYVLDTVSSTFHGRDVFSPVAAHLANGVAIGELGPALDPAELVRLELPEPSIGTARIRATVLYVDRFGNVQLNLRREDLEQVGIVSGTRVEVEAASDRFFAVAARTFADVRPGEVLLYENSYGSIALALNQGNAAQVFGSKVGGELRISPVRE